MIDKPEIEFLVLADRAEAHDGKLYLMGGAWDRLQVGDFRQPIVFGVGICVMVPSRLAGRDLGVCLAIEREDGTPVPGEVCATVNAVPTQDHPYGRPLRVIIAGNATWILPGVGTYRILASVDGEVGRVALLYAVGPNLSQVYQATGIPRNTQA